MFNLTKQQWIPVVTSDYQLQEVSLSDLFKNWNDYIEIKAEEELTTYAIYRLLMAIMHKVYQGPEDLDHWVKIKEDNGAQILTYLENNANKFDILDPDYPFYQDAIAKTKPHPIFYAFTIKGGSTGALWGTHLNPDTFSLSFAEAARLILRIQLFDKAGKQPGEQLESIANGSSSHSHLKNAVITYPQGDTVKETILYNLVQYEPSSTPDLAIWERTYQDPAAKNPDGYVEYLTYRWRSIKLYAEQNRIVAISIHAHGGDKIDDGFLENITRFEPHIAYRKSKSKSSKGQSTEEKGFRKLRIEPGKRAWRNSHILTRSYDNDSKTTECAKVSKFLASLYTSGFLHKRNIPYKVLGIKTPDGTAGAAKVEYLLEEDLIIPTKFLTEQALWEKLKEAIELAERFGTALEETYSQLNTTAKNTERNGLRMFWNAIDDQFINIQNDIAQEIPEALENWQKKLEAISVETLKTSIQPLKLTKMIEYGQAINKLKFKIFCIKGKNNAIS